MYFFLLVLTISPNPIPDNVYKQPKVSKTLLEEGFKLIPGQKIFGGLVPELVLILAKIDLATKERSGKKYLTNPSGNCIDKIIFIMLAKVVALYMTFSMVKVRESCFKRTFLRAWFWMTCLRLEEQIGLE